MPAAATASRAGPKASSAAQLALALAHVARGQRPVAVEGGVVAALGVDVEGDLVAAGDERAEPDRRLGGKPGQRLVEQAITHAPRFRPTPGAPAPARRLADAATAGQATLGLDARPGTALGVFGEPARAVAAHVLDQRHQRLALLGQRVLDPGRHLGEGVALDDALLFQRPQAQREGARADPLQRALQLAEAARALGQVADDEEGPLAADDFGRAADGTSGVADAALIGNGEAVVSIASLQRV